MFQWSQWQWKRNNTEVSDLGEKATGKVKGEKYYSVYLDLAM